VELIVVDNASSDDPSEAVRAWRGERRLIALERNVGFGAAANAGVEAARHEGVVLLNPDTVLLDPSLGGLVELALSRGVLAGPRLLNPDRSPQPSASGPPVGIWPWMSAVVPG
jgi:GT2 family glycosyltransferase